MDIKEEQIVQQKKMEKILYTYGLENLLSTNITEDKDLEQFDYGIQKIFDNEPEVVFYYSNNSNMQYIINSDYCENINTFFLDNPTLVSKYRHTQFVQQYRHAQELINQIDLDAKTLFRLSKNNIFAKQFIKENLNTIFEKRPDLLLCFDKYKIVQDFIDNLHNNEKQYDIIKNWLKEGLKNYPTNILDYQNAPIIKLYSEDLLADQEFKTSLHDTLKKPENKHFFLHKEFENNSIIKDFIEKNPDHINKILTNNYLILHSNDRIVQNFTKNLEKGSERYEAIKNGLKEYLEKTPWLVIEYQNTDIIKDLLEDQDFRTLLYDTLKKPKNNNFFLSQEYENNSFVKDFVKNNLEDINKILTKNPHSLILRSDSRVAQNFIDNLKKDSEQYKATKNRLKEYLTGNLTPIYRNSTFLELFSKDLLADQEFRILLDNDLKKPQNNRFFLSQRFENNSFIKDFVERNLEDINKILKANPEDIKFYKDSQVVQQYQEAQTLIEQTKLSAESIGDEIYDLLELSDNNIFAKQYIEQNQNTIFEKKPDLLLDCNDNKIVQDFIDKLKTNGQYDIIKSELTKYFKASPQEIIYYLNTPIIKLYSEDLLADQDFIKSLDNDLKQLEKNKKYFLSQTYQENSLIKDFVERNLEDINKILKANPEDIKFYKDSQVVKQYELQKLQKNNTLLEEVGQEFSSIILSNSSTKEIK